jgi:hypothetical protein
LKAANACNHAGIPFSVDNHNVSDEPQIGAGSSTGNQESLGFVVRDTTATTAAVHETEIEEDVLISVKDLAVGDAHALLSTSFGSSSSSVSSVTERSYIKPILDTNENEARLIKKKPDVVPRRNFNIRDSGSISRTPSLTACGGNPCQGLFDTIETITEPQRRRATTARSGLSNGAQVTEAISHITWGINDYLAPATPEMTIATVTGRSELGHLTVAHLAADIPGTIGPINPSVAHLSSSEVTRFALQHQQQVLPHLADYSHPAPLQADMTHTLDEQLRQIQHIQNALGIFRAQQQCNEVDNVSSARRYSEVLKRYPAIPPMSQFSAFTSRPSIDDVGECPRTADSMPGRSRGVFALNETGFAHNAWLNYQHWNGQGYDTPQ